MATYYCRLQRKASTGPRSEERGGYGNKDRSGFGATLQRGRAPKSAEAQGRPAWVLSPWMLLQRGRAPKSAEACA